MALLYYTTDIATGKRQASPLKIARSISGLEDPSKFSVTYDPVTRTLEVVHQAGAALWVAGERIEKTGSESVTHATTGAQYWFYYNSSGTLVVSTSEWDRSIHAAVGSASTRTTTTTNVFSFDSRYQAIAGLDIGTYSFLQKAVGARALSGFDISGYTIGGTSEDALSYAVAAGQLLVGDKTFTTNAITEGGTPRIIFRDSWGWMARSDGVAGLLLSGGNPVYNMNGTTLATISDNNRWFNYYVIAVPELSGTHRLAILVGQQLYTSAAGAIAEDPSTSFVELEKFSKDYVLLYQLTYERVAASAPANSKLINVKAMRFNEVDRTSKFQAPTQVGTGVSTENFTSTGQTVFQLVTDIQSGDNIKVFVAGRLMREGASDAWTRDVANNRITMSETVVAGQWVCVEIIRG